MHMTTGMSILIADAPGKERVFAELYYNDELWAIVSLDEGNLLLDIFSNIEGAPSKFPFDDVMETLQEAKKKLLG